MNQDYNHHQSSAWGLYLGLEAGFLVLVGILGPQFGYFAQLPKPWGLGLSFLVGATAAAGSARSAWRMALVTLVSGLLTYAAFGQLREEQEIGFLMLMFVGGAHWAMSVGLLKPQVKFLALLGPPLALASGAGLATFLLPIFGLGLVRVPAIIAVLMAAVFYLTS